MKAVLSSVRGGSFCLNIWLVPLGYQEIAARALFVHVRNTKPVVGVVNEHTCTRIVLVNKKYLHTALMDNLSMGV